MGVVIEICIKYPGGRTRIRGTEVADTRNCAGRLKNLPELFIAIATYQNTT
jgi:hypothetical protein